MRTRVAVVFGGRSPEHDVSVMTGLQALGALDQQFYEGFPVYIGLDGIWWVGEALRERRNYVPDSTVKASLDRVTVQGNPGMPGGLLVGARKGGLFGRKDTSHKFDVALLALHGLNGEDGRLQGAFELADIAYTGMRLLPSALLMNKAATKTVLAQTGLSEGIPMLPFVVIDRPDGSFMPPATDIEAIIKGMAFPLIVKPNHLGSSIGVAKVDNIDELRASLPTIFTLDDQAIIEPFVHNLVEYNVAVTKMGGKIVTSAIERPKSSTKLLDFKEKYLSGAGDGKKQGATSDSEGMLSLTRDINPDLPSGMADKIRSWATTCFNLIGGTGVPRIDFLSNASTGEVWLNEVNPCPGSFGYFLWERATEPMLFGQLLDKLIQEALQQQKAAALPADPTLEGARLFKRP